jgi:hypothetical protein
MYSIRENFLFDTGLKCDSLFDTWQYFLPYLTFNLNMFPYMTLSLVPLPSSVKKYHMAQNTLQTMEQIKTPD